ncbi:hypothetical protein [Gimesia chilikensis]|uniref:hypothetical protein n=1 Tax=Gimesia chilikensis TaxID=2605989 RepID=UPI003A8E553C
MTVCREAGSQYWREAKDFGLFFYPTVRRQADSAPVRHFQPDEKVLYVKQQ